MEFRDFLYDFEFISLEEKKLIKDDGNQAGAEYKFFAVVEAYKSKLFYELGHAGEARKCYGRMVSLLDKTDWQEASSDFTKKLKYHNLYLFLKNKKIFDKNQEIKNKFYKLINDTDIYILERNIEQQNYFEYGKLMRIVEKNKNRKNKTTVNKQSLQKAKKLDITWENNEDKRKKCRNSSYSLNSLASKFANRESWDKGEALCNITIQMNKELDLNLNLLITKNIKSKIYRYKYFDDQYSNENFFNMSMKLSDEVLKKADRDFTKARAHYNKCALYFNIGDKNKAKTHLKKHNNFVKEVNGSLYFLEAYKEKYKDLFGKDDTIEKINKKINKKRKLKNKIKNEKANKTNNSLPDDFTVPF